MIIRTIAVSYQRKFNLGDFNSVDFSCSLWAQIDPQEDEDTCIQILQDKCRDHVRAEYKLVKNGSKPTELFRVNVADDDNTNDSNGSENDYSGLEPDEVFDIGDK